MEGLCEEGMEVTVLERQDKTIMQQAHDHWGWLFAKHDGTRKSEI